MSATTSSTAIDPQVQFDAEIARDFRLLVTRLASDIRHHKIAEAKLREAVKTRRLERRRAEHLEERCINTFDGADTDFVVALQARQCAVEEAQLAEQTAMNVWKTERIRRRQAQLELQVAVKNFCTPLPLFDRVAEESLDPVAEKDAEPEKPKQSRKRKGATT